MVFYLLLDPENCCLLSPIGSRELLFFLSSWLQRIVVFSLLLAAVFSAYPGYWLMNFSTYHFQNVLEIFVISTVLCLRDPTLLLLYNVIQSTGFFSAIQFPLGSIVSQIPSKRLNLRLIWCYNTYHHTSWPGPCALPDKLCISRSNLIRNIIILRKKLKDI